jgi:hypothetical protein
MKKTNGSMSLFKFELQFIAHRLSSASGDAARTAHFQSARGVPANWLLFRRKSNLQ